MKLDPRAAIRKGLAPRSIAVIDASDNPHKIGGRPLAYLSRFGFQGKVYAINPQRAQVQGFASFASFSALPEVPDLVIIALPGELAVTAVSECAAAGVAMCIIMSSGFSESGEAARLQEENMVACARVAGMRLVGPNSQGLANFSNGAVASFSTMFTEVDPADGPVGIVSQSGAMAVIPYGLLRGHGIGVRHSHATGNDCDVTVCELATVIAEDPGLKLLILYLEGIPDPWHLAEAAAIARAQTAGDRAEIRPHAGGPDGGHVAHRLTGQRRPRGRCLFRRTRHLAREKHGRSGRHRAAVLARLETQGPPAGGD